MKTLKMVNIKKKTEKKKKRGSGNYKYTLVLHRMGFPGGLVVKSLPIHVEDTEDMSSIPG